MGYPRPHVAAEAREEGAIEEGRDADLGREGVGEGRDADEDTALVGAGEGIEGADEQ